MDEVGKYCVAAARRRGYPEVALGTIARHVGFLEQRGLPGFAAVIREVTGFRAETLEERGRLERPDGRKGGGCPIIMGAGISDSLGDYMSAPEGKIACLPAPSHSGLMLPRLAGFAGSRGIVAMTQWFVKGERVAHAIMDGHRIAYHGSIDAFFAADEIGIMRYPEERLPEPGMRAAYVSEIPVPTAFLDKLARWIETGQ